MPRIAGVDVPADKAIGVALTYIYGVGNHTARRILGELNLPAHVRARSLSDEDLARINTLIDKKITVEGQLRRHVQQSIQRLKDIRCYRGVRHIRSLPVRGQQTQSNARTRKGPRKTVAGKKSVKAAR